MQWPCLEVITLIYETNTCSLKKYFIVENACINGLKHNQWPIKQSELVITENNIEAKQNNL